MHLAIKIAILVLLFSNSHARFAPLVNEFLDQSFSAAKLRSSLTLSTLGLDALHAKRFWALSYAGAYDDNDLEGMSSSTNKLKTTSHSLSLSRDFLYGTSFSLSNNLLKYDRSRWSQTTLAGQEPTIHEFNQTLTLSQDLGANFFGRQSRTEIEASVENVQATKEQVDFNLDMSLLGLYQNYLQAKLDKTLLLQKEEGLNRAKRRQVLIQKRVRDGLREKVDLFQSKMEVASQAETVKQQSLTLSQTLDKLSTKIHRSIEPSSIPLYSFDSPILNQIPEGTLQNNKQLAYLDKMERSAKLSVAEATMGLIPTVNLSLSYKTNQYDETQGTAFSDGKLGSEPKEYTAAVSVVWPIGFDGQKIAKSQKSVASMLATKEKETAKKNLETTQEKLREQIRFLDENIRSIQKRIMLADKVLKEYNRLYNQGRADLDQVIRAEESLLATQSAYAAYLYNRNLLIANLHNIQGSLKTHLLAQ